MRTRTILGGVALAAAATLALSACSGGGTSAPGASGEAYKIGISQLVQHPALDSAVTGFKQAFTDAGITVEWDEQNANGNQPTAVTIASSFSADADMDLVLAVATPAAQAAAQAITDKPVLFTAVTDPVAADLVKSLDAPGANVTGTNDMNPVADQIGLIKEIQPAAQTVGIIYSSGEVNSEVQVKAAKEAAAALGMQVSEATITAANEIPTALSTLGSVDAIYVPTDNTVVSGISAVVQYTEQHQIGLYSGDTGPVDEGAVATLGLDYTKLGYQTGQMAIKILTQGADPATTPVESQTTFDLVINPEAAARMGITIPQAVVDRAATVVGK